MGFHRPMGICKLQSSWTLVDGRLMHARVFVHKPRSEFPAAVLVHGLGVSSHYMVPTATRLAPSCSVYAPDLPGFGRSAHPAHVLNVPQMADALDGWMEAVGLDSAVFIGNSMGCQVIVDLAVRYPGRVERAVLTGPTFDRAARASFLVLVRRALRDGHWEPRSLSPIILNDYLLAGPVRIAQTLRYGLLDPIEDKLPRMAAPTLIVRGEHDYIVPMKWAQYVTWLLPSARFVEISGASHAVNFSAPGKLARATLPFLHGRGWPD